MPESLRGWLEKERKNHDKDDKQTEVSPQKYFKLPQDVTIVTVKHNSELEEINKQLELVERVGADTESDVYTGAVQLLQIATHKYCFLIRQKHVDQLDRSLLQQLGKTLSTKTILFFAMHNDYKQMANFIPNIATTTQLLDMQKLAANFGFTVITRDNQKT